MDTRFCLSCGTAVPAGARFCPKCGNEFLTPADLAETEPAYIPPVAPPPSAPRTDTPAPPAPERKSNTLLMVAIALVVLVVLALLFLLGMPFGAGDREIERRQVETDTVGESPAPQGQPSLGVTETGQIEELPPLVPVPPNTTTSTTTVVDSAPYSIPDRASVPPASRNPSAVPPVGRTTPPPVRSVPEPAQRGAVTETDAIAIVRGAAHSYYDGVTGECLNVASEGYRNVGYTMSVRDSCRGTALGRWRVDARNGDVFRQREDGRFLKP